MISSELALSLLVAIFANSLDPDQDQLKIDPDLDPRRLAQV